MGKKLVRIDMDVWGGGLQIRAYPIVKESEHVVFVVRERERRNPETGYKETVKVPGPFNRKDLKIHRPRPGVRRGYMISEAEDPQHDPFCQAFASGILTQIGQDLRDAVEQHRDILLQIIEG